MPRRGYTYDEQGVRSSKTVNNVTTTFHYNGSLLMAQVQGSGASQVKQLYSYDASGDVISVNYNGTEYFYLRNGQNDIVGLMDGSGTRVVEYTYDAWGKLISTTGTLASTLGANNPFRYRGYYYDTETGLYYLTTRYYDPEVCRFISADVYMTTGQGVLGGNIFAYCLNNPVNMVDAQGDIAVIDDALLLLLLLLVGTIETAAYVGTDVSTSSVSNIGGILSDPLPAIKETYVETFVVAAVMVTVLTTPRTGSGISVVTSPDVDSKLSEPYVYYKEHTNGARPSTLNPHQKGQVRKKRDARGEKGDSRRPYKKGNTKKVPPKNGPGHTPK